MTSDRYAPTGAFLTKFYEWLDSPDHLRLGRWLKFSVSRLDPAGQPHAIAEPRSCLDGAGWGDEHYLVTDLQAGIGLILRLHPRAYLDRDLQKRGVEVSTDFRVFLETLYNIVRQYPDWWNETPLLRGPYQPDEEPDRQWRNPLDPRIPPSVRGEPPTPRSRP